MTSTAFHVQLGLFAGCAEVADMHTVSAHTRLMSDGSEVFVGEHLRWNGGRRAHRAARFVRRAFLSPPSPDQPGLFDEPEAQLSFASVQRPVSKS